MNGNDDMTDAIAIDMAVTWKVMMAWRHMDADMDSNVAVGTLANLGLIYTAHINNMIISAQPKIYQTKN